ncbi:immunoglobulin superfamily member 6 isoform X2 [Patagioenas fasciata]|uniref:immunoglobulin superfamily member 6 isoform X2 n=1 Tax=Patagioenas fasciata TaxID=372321 RepID=UPI003A99E6E3
MVSFAKLKNLLMLAFDWILHGAGPADTCHVTVTQPRFQGADYSMHTVFLTCAFSASGCSPSSLQILWFRFVTSKHEDLCTPGCTDQQKYKVHFLPENNVSLQINDLTVDDNAVYICGIAFSDSSSPHSKQTGDGTVLMKTGMGLKCRILRKLCESEELSFILALTFTKGAETQHSNGKVVSIFMIITSALLFLYSTTVFMFLMIYKLKPKLLKASGKEGQRTENCDTLEDDTIYQNR